MLKPEFKLITDRSAFNRAKYVIQPLIRSLGTTIGIALRRTLLSAVPSSAVIGYRIKGYNHEYNTVTGVVETLLQISLNFKQLLVQMDPQVFAPDAVVTLTLTKNFKTGAAQVKGSDIECPAGVKIINPDLLICHLAPGGKIKIEIFCKIQTGFCLASANRRLKSVSDFIAIDSKHTPVERVAYQVKPIQMGENTKLESLTLEVVTNGVVSASDAVKAVAKELVYQFNFWIHLDQTLIQPTSGQSPTDEVLDPLDTSIFDLELTQRSENCLIGSGIRTLRELVGRTEPEIKAIKSLGRKSFEEIRNKVRDLKLTFATVNA